MFGWLAKWLIKAPVVGSGCACCEAKKEQLKQMQKTILGEDDADENRLKEGCGCGGCGCENCGCEKTAREDLSTSYHYKL